MTVAAEELNNVDFDFMIGKKTYHLRSFDLYARVWATEEFKTKECPNGLTALTQRLQNQWHDLPAITKCVYHVLREKNKFQTYQSFIDYIDKDSKHNDLILVDLYNVFIKCLKASEPSPDDLSEGNELKKSRAAAS